MNAEFLLTRERNQALTIYTITDQAYRVHFHSHIELCLILDGEMEVWINDQRKLLKQGELSVAWSYDTHGYQTPNHSLSLSAIIPPKMFQEFLPLFLNRHTSSPFLSDPSLFDQIHSWILATQKCEDELTRKGYIYIILGTLIQNMDFDKDPAQTDYLLISKVLLYLNENFRENLSLSSVAKVLGYHPNHMSHMFKSTLKIGFNQYLTLLRLRESLLLMQDGNKSITECAFESGFQSLRTFYRAFQAEFGCAPRDYASYAGLQLLHRLFT